MTKKIYEMDPYIKEIDAKIIKICDKEKYVILDKTIFFPEGGGQPFDTGYINDCKVLKVYEKENLIYHYVDKLPEKNDVKLKINWERRLDHMQQHCGEHIISGMVYKLFGGINRGFHMGNEIVTCDFDVFLNKDELNEIENECNRLISEGKQIYIKKLRNRETLSDYKIRKETLVEENIRLVEIEDVDCVACCGTHPTNIKDVMLIKILGAEKNKKYQRISFLCGFRAIRDYKEKHEVIKEINSLLSSETLSAKQRIETLKSQKDELVRKNIEMQKKLVSVYIKEIIEKYNTNSKINETFICYECSHLERDGMILLQNQFFKEGKGSLLLFNNNIFLCRTTNEIDLNRILRETIGDYNGKGGGKKDNIQAKFETSENCFKYIKLLSQKIKDIEEV